MFEMGLSGFIYSKGIFGGVVWYSIGSVWGVLLCGGLTLSEVVLTRGGKGVWEVRDRSEMVYMRVKGRVLERV